MLVVCLPRRDQAIVTPHSPKMAKLLLLILILSYFFISLLGGTFQHRYKYTYAAILGITKETDKSSLASQIACVPDIPFAGGRLQECMICQMLDEKKPVSVINI